MARKKRYKKTKFTLLHKNGVMENVSRLNALDKLRCTDTSDVWTPTEREFNENDLNEEYKWSQDEPLENNNLSTQFFIQLTSAKVSETSFIVQFNGESYEVDKQNGFMAKNFITNSMSFVADRNGKKNSILLGKVKQSDFAKVRFKVEPKSTYQLRDLSLLKLSHKNLIHLEGLQIFQDCYIYMFPYYEHTLQMLRTKLPNNSQLMYDAKIPQKVCLEILNAVEYLHKEKVSHRGIQDSNVYIVRQSSDAEWLQNGDFCAILGENSTLKCDKSFWKIKHCSSDSGILTPESDEQEHDLILGNDPTYRSARKVLELSESSFKEFDHWLKYDLVKAIELIVNVYNYCGFSKSNPEIKNLENLSFEVEFNINDIKSHPLFMDRKESFVMLQTVAQEIGENYKAFLKKINNKDHQQEILQIGSALLGPSDSWLSFFAQDNNILASNFLYPKKIFIGKYYNKFLEFIHILLKHVPQMDLKLLGIFDKWDVMDYIVKNKPDCRMQIYLLQKKLKLIGVIKESK